MAIFKQSTFAADGYAITLGIGFFALSSFFSYIMKCLVRPLITMRSDPENPEAHNKTMDHYDVIMATSVYLLTIAGLLHAHHLLPHLVTTPISLYPLCVGGLMCILIKYIYNQLMIGLYCELKDYESELLNVPIIKNHDLGQNCHISPIESKSMEIIIADINHQIDYHQMKPQNSAIKFVRYLAFALWIIDMDSAIDKYRESSLASLSENRRIYESYQLTISPNAGQSPTPIS